MYYLFQSVIDTSFQGVKLYFDSITKALVYELHHLTDDLWIKKNVSSRLSLALTS